MGVEVSGHLSGRVNAGFEVFNLDGPAQNSPVYKSPLPLADRQRHPKPRLVKVLIDQRQRLATSVSTTAISIGDKEAIRHARLPR